MASNIWKPKSIKLPSSVRITSMSKLLNMEFSNVLRPDKKWKALMLIMLLSVLWEGPLRLVGSFSKTIPAIHKSSSILISGKFFVRQMILGVMLSKAKKSISDLTSHWSLNLTPGICKTFRTIKSEANCFNSCNWLNSSLKKKPRLKWHSSS